jgi:hypothetical protein
MPLTIVVAAAAVASPNNHHSLHHCFEKRQTQSANLGYQRFLLLRGPRVLDSQLEDTPEVAIEQNEQNPVDIVLPYNSAAWHPVLNH